MKIRVINAKAKIRPSIRYDISMVELVLGIMLGTWASFLVSLITKQVEVWPFVIVMVACTGLHLVRQKMSKWCY